MLENGRRQMAALDRVAGLGRLTAGLAHEVKTPIAATMNSLDSAKKLLTELVDSIGHEGVTEADLREIAGELQDSMTSAVQTTQRVGQIIRRVREHTHGMNATSLTEFRVLDRARLRRQGVVAHLLLRSRERSSSSRRFRPMQPCAVTWASSTRSCSTWWLMRSDATSSAREGGSVVIATLQVAARRAGGLRAR